MFAARALIVVWGFAVAFGLDAFTSLSPLRRFALGGGLAALMAGGVGIAHWGFTPSLGVVVLVGSVIVGTVLQSPRSLEHCKRN